MENLFLTSLRSFLISGYGIFNAYNYHPSTLLPLIPRQGILNSLYENTENLQYFIILLQQLMNSKTGVGIPAASLQKQLNKKEEEVDESDSCSRDSKITCCLKKQKYQVEQQNHTKLEISQQSIIREGKYQQPNINRQRFQNQSEARSLSSKHVQSSVSRDFRSLFRRQSHQSDFSQKQEDVQSRKQFEMTQKQQTLLRINQTKEKIYFFKCKDVAIFLLDTAQRNQTYLRNFAHFLVPYGIVLLESYSVSRDEKTFLMQLFYFVVKKINRPKIREQIENKQNFEQYLNFFVNYKKVTHRDVIACLRKFLQRERQMTQAVCPYYYNFFAFVVNKEIVFGGNHQEKLVQYTVDFKHKYYGQQFQIPHVLAQIQQMELMLVQKYHSKDI